MTVRNCACVNMRGQLCVTDISDELLMTLDMLPIRIPYSDNGRRRYTNACFAAKVNPLQAYMFNSVGTDVVNSFTRFEVRIFGPLFIISDEINGVEDFRESIRLNGIDPDCILVPDDYDSEGDMQ